jgi:uncharacterized membrane protein
MLTRPLKGYKSILWQIIFAVFFMLMLDITLQYFPYNSNVAFLQIKQSEVQTIPNYLFFFYLHVYTAIFCLIAGFTQFNSYLLKKFKNVHSSIGKLYVLVVLVAAAPSGFFIGLYANGGMYSKLAFILLASLWFFYTLKAYIEIKRGRIKSHKKYMLRSFALTFSAITLRLWKVILVYLFHPAPMDVYQIVAWLGWVPNLLIIEYYIFNLKQNE